MSIEIPREDYIENGPIQAAKMRNIQHSNPKSDLKNIYIFSICDELKGIEVV